jgi:TnpA family transposase
MPAHIRRELLTAAQRAELLALPTDRLEIRERYLLTPTDFDLINRHRTEANRLGFAIQLCLLRYPGRSWLPTEQLPSEMLRFIARQIGPEPTALADYAQRDETRREHQQELLTAFGWKTIDRLTYRVLSIDLLRACNCCMKVSKLITSQ